MMKSLRLTMLICSLAVFTGCSSMSGTTHYNEWLVGKSATDGLAEPCIKCGEDWIFINNEPFAAQNQSRREQGYDGTNYEVVHY